MPCSKLYRALKERPARLIGSFVDDAVLVHQAVLIAALVTFRPVARRLPAPASRSCISRVGSTPGERVRFRRY